MLCVLPSIGLAKDSDVLSKLTSQEPIVDVSEAFKIWNHYDSKKQLKSREYDLNGDGKADLFEEYDKQGRLTLRKQDRNFDGKIDEITKFIGQKIIRETDTKFTGHFDRIEEQSWDGDSLSVHVKVDRQGAGKFEEESIQAFPPQQGDHDGEKAFQVFTDEGAKPGPLKKRSDGSYDTTYHYRIAKECVDQFPKINETFHAALSEGLTCIEKLKTEKTNEHLAKFASLLVQKIPPPTLACLDDKEFKEKKFGNGDAYGSVPGGSGHPQIVFNVRAVKEITNPEIVKQLIIKESFHNLNYVHGKEMEFGEACAWTCFAGKILKPGPEAKRSLELAERICRGAYPKGIADPAYLDDFTEFASVIEKPFYPIITLKTLLHAKPDDADLHLRFLKAHLGPAELPMAVAWSKIVRRYDSPLSEEDKKVLSYLEELEKKSPILKVLGEQQAPLAEAYDQLFHGRIKAAKDLLEKTALIDGNALPANLPVEYRNALATSSNDSRKLVVQDLVKSYEFLSKTAGNPQKSPEATKALRESYVERAETLKELYYVPSILVGKERVEGGE
jgi:hypothetical protein